MNYSYHPGELKMQEMSGEFQIAQSRNRMIANEIMGGVVPYLQEQSLLILSSSNRAGEIWISALLGEPGFIQVPNEKEMHIQLSSVFSHKEDILFQNLKEMPEAGSMTMDLAHRRRFRINGPARLDGDSIKIGVREAYGNCPKFIQRRIIHAMDLAGTAQASIEQGKKLKGSQIEWIQAADTFFVGSKSAEGKLDASHRGGNPGFVEVQGDNKLRIPDYPGNSLFNTLGNFYENPQAGLMFLDFEQGKSLQLTGKVEIQMDQHSAEDMKKSGNSGRFWTFEIDRWIETKNHHPVDWELVDYSPYNP